MAAVKISVSLPDALVERLDDRRGLATRSAFIAACVERLLDGPASPAGVQAVRSQVGPPSSAAAKRNVQPIPKGGK